MSMCSLAPLLHTPYNALILFNDNRPVVLTTWIQVSPVIVLATCILHAPCVNAVCMHPGIAHVAAGMLL
jgi:hypothetical protein